MSDNKELMAEYGELILQKEILDGKINLCRKKINEKYARKREEGKEGNKETVGK